MFKKCLVCKKKFYVRPIHIKTGKGKTCSYKCGGIMRKGKKVPKLSKALMGHIPWNKNKKGIHLSPKSEFKKGSIPWNKGKKCPHLSSKNANNWKGGRMKHGDGYILLYRPNHPFCDSHSYVFEHRLVMEKKLGRYLKPCERSHHRNQIKDDNRPKNLKYFPNESKHVSFHNKYLRDYYKNK